MAGIQIDGVNNKIDFDDDADTSISSASDDTLVVEVGGNTLATVTSTSVTFNDGVEITVNDNSNTLKLTSTDADATNGPILRMFRDSSSPADSDETGRIIFSADNDAGEETNYFEMKSIIVDASDGTEDGQLRLSGIVAGSSVEYLRFDTGGTERLQVSSAGAFALQSAGGSFIHSNTISNTFTLTSQNMFMVGPVRVTGVITVGSNSTVVVI